MSEMKGKRLLVLGCGYLGRILVREAIERGMRVMAVSRNVDTLVEVEALGAEIFAGRVDSDSWHEAAGSYVDFVVNCVSSAGGGLEGYRQSYIEGNHSLCKWAEQVGFSGRSLYTSSVSVYGDADGKWVDEVSAPPPSNERGGVVLKSESIFLEGMPAGKSVVLRLAGLYGPGRHLMLDRLRMGVAELPGFGDYYLNLVRIEDVAASVWGCFEAETAVSGVYTVVDEEPALKEEIAGWIAETTGNQRPRFTGRADTSGRASRRLGENGRPANRRISNAALKAALGWRPKYLSFREGFSDLLGEG